MENNSMFGKRLIFRGLGYSSNALRMEYAGSCFWRFVQLAAMAGVIYYLIFHFIMPWLSDQADSLTRQMVDERVVFHPESRMAAAIERRR